MRNPTAMPSLIFNVSVEESHAILKKVLPLMSQQHVPTIPQNYAVWYDYVCEANPELVAELRDRMTRGLRFSPDACRLLYEKYFLDSLRRQVDGLQAGMRQTLDAMLGEVGNLDDSLGSFASVLDAAADSLARDPTRGDLDALVARLVQETHAARRRGAEVEASVRRMKAELDELRVQVDALTRESRLDTLTGVANRRAFDDALVRMTGEVNDVGGELCLLMVDVDQFPRFNETHGQDVGDQVLRFVAQGMNQCVKGRDLLARYTGEQFAILLPATSYNGGLMLAESLRAIIEAQVVETDEGAAFDNLTISMGVARYRADEDVAGFVARATACLSQSTAQGRNRVTGERDLRGD